MTTGLKFSERDVDPDQRAWLDAQPMVARCTLCAWSFEGEALEARTAQTAHRVSWHPETFTGRRRGSRAAVRVDAEVAADRRARLHGVARSSA